MFASGQVGENNNNSTLTKRCVGVCKTTIDNKIDITCIYTRGIYEWCYIYIWSKFITAEILTSLDSYIYLGRYIYVMFMNIYACKIILTLGVYAVQERKRKDLSTICIYQRHRDTETVGENDRFCTMARSFYMDVKSSV